MPRLPRYLLPPEGVYHVTARGVAPSVISCDDDDRRFFLALLGQVVRRSAWDCHVFCLMPNHYQLIVKSLLDRLSWGLHRLNGVYAQTFNQRHRRSGHLFGDRFAASSSATTSIFAPPPSTSSPTRFAPASAKTPATGRGAAPAGDYPPAMPSDDLQGQVALVTGGGRGIGADIAHELASAGARVAVAARTREQVEAVADEIGGLALEVDVADQDAVEGMMAEAERSIGPIDLLVANAGIGNQEGPSWEVDADSWWRIFEVNVLGVHHCCRAVVQAMLARGRGRIVITASGAAYLPGSSHTAYPASKAAVCRYGETLANELAGRIPVFFFSPGLVKTEMTSRFGDDAAWTPPELAPRLVRVLASGRADALAGRYIHAEHDDIEDLIQRADQVASDDLNAIRLRR